jgi:ribosomal-protein-alanine N-acetyltransferase
VTVLTTTRLILAPLTHELIEKRLATDDFQLDVPDVGVVFFAPHWPGDALGMFAQLVESGADPVPDSYVAIERASAEAVGLLGTTSQVDENGAIEIGYGFGVPGQGFATEGVEVFVAHLLSTASIVAIIANTAVGNVASQRVLEKNGFRQVATSTSEEDGDLLVWTHDYSWNEYLSPGYSPESTSAR